MQIREAGYDSFTGGSLKKSSWSLHPMMLISVELSLVGSLPKLILGELERRRVIAQVSFALPPGGIQDDLLETDMTSDRSSIGRE